MKFLSPKEHQRADTLERQRHLKMARSAQAYVRGSTAVFYEWLKSSQGKIPEGPPIWICGDCHVGNLGPVADSKGNVEIEIRDLDQTIIGNPAHDLIRLAVSLSMAARSSDLPGVTTALMLEQMMIGYSEALKPSKKSATAAKKAGKPIRIVLKEALSRKWRHLATERIEDVRPKIPLGRKFWALSKAEHGEIERLFESKNAQLLVSVLRKEASKQKVKVLDAAYWMKGCSSLGRLRYAVLLGIGKRFCLIDIKEAVAAAAPGKNTKGIPRDHAERLVAGARALSPFLGERMTAEKFRGKPVVIRELRPQDLKFEFDRITQEEAVEAAKFLSGIVGRAHARQLTPIQRIKWLSSLNRRRIRLNAPGWLWECVVELVSAHEAEYLEHCRRYALAQA
jgi:uncharacterized protein (DUF2252 family)